MITMNQIAGFRCFEISLNIDTTNTGYSDYVVIPSDMDRVAVQLFVNSTASVTVQASISTIDELAAGTAKWKDWDNGTITGNIVSQDSTKGPVGAIRTRTDVALAGNNANLSIRAQKGNI